jgi:hypothetical protein
MQQAWTSMRFGLPTPVVEMDSPVPPILQTRTNVSQLVLVELTQSHALMLMLHVIQPKPTNQLFAALVLPDAPLPQLKS